MKALAYIAASAVLAFAACSGKTETAATSDNDGFEATTVVEEAPADNVIEVAAGQTAIDKSDKLVVIDFNAEWCGPCQKFKPVFHAASAKYADQAVFYSVNVDSCGELASAYNVSSIPQITFIKPDGTVTSDLGYKTEAEFDSIMTAVLAK